MPITSIFYQLDYGAADIILMLDELHHRGYEGLRLLPGMSPNGCCWRWAIYPRKWLKDDLYLLERCHDGVPFECPLGSIGYPEHKADVVKMADDFMNAYPELCHDAHHPSPNYTEWFARLVEKAQSGVVPIAYADGWGPQDAWEFLDGEPLPYPPYYVKK